ncbi:hypothetical protein [Pseudomonas oligotrophica]|uniref:hypothetical protein n=1 Tax=Pseudomonas oligotrophica TaxID=2912055 RepID=UPI001F401513|nr:hypothetical protein [Pseudomonas oligotrophica]MCF7203582.1 hypothetical protein [Pseudomonas oligotrophica]
MKKLLNNRAAIYHNATIAIKSLAGPITFILIAKSFTELEQGLFFAFLSIGALQLIFEAGMTTSFVQHIASERRRSYESELYYGLLKGCVIWCSVSAIFFYLTSVAFAFYVFSGFSIQLWLLPLNVFALALSLNMFSLFIYVVQEGSGDILFVYKTRLWGAVVSLALLWLSLFFEAGLYSLAAAQIGYLIPLFIQGKTWRCMAHIFTSSEANVRLAMYGLASFQFRLTAVWVSGYLYWNSPVLLIFKFVDPVYAGKFGLTFSLMNAINQIGQGWLTTQRVRIGTMIADRKFKIARKLFDDVSKFSLLIVISGLLCAVLMSAILSEQFFFPRALNTISFFVMGIYFALLCRISNLATYTRCYKEEPLFKLFLIMNIVVPAALYLSGLLNSIEIGLIFVVLIHFAFLFAAERITKNFERGYS